MVYLEPLQTDAVTPRFGRNAPTVAISLNSLFAPSALLWDVRHPLETLEGRLPQDVRVKLGQNATQPPSARLEIRTPHLPWRIEVRPKTPNLCVTVLDVLVTIRGALKLQITPGEWARFSTIRKTLTLAERSSRVLEYDQGRRADGLYNHPLRMDSLGEFTQFGGLVRAPGRGPGSLDLKLERRR